MTRALGDYPDPVLDWDAEFEPDPRVVERRARSIVRAPDYDTAVGNAIKALSIGRDPAEVVAALATWWHRHHGQAS